MLIEKFYNGIEIHRNEKVIVVKFLVPHRVISTCRANGGIRDDFDLVFNHQSCEPTGHMRETHNLAVHAPGSYLDHICGIHGFSKRCASLGTAANMNCAAIKKETFRDLQVVAICTGGVETNAGRAGDPSFFYENEGTFEAISSKTPEPHGTINTILCINKELTPGAMVRSVMMATEAKTAALQELDVSSCYSDGLATGTGTDQIAVASCLGNNTPLTGAGKHTKLGELIGLAVKKAVTGTLELQNGMTPLSRRSVLVQLERLGSDREDMENGIKRNLSDSSGELLSKNFLPFDHDPVTVSAVAAIMHVRDKFMYGILPGTCMPEILGSLGAHVSAAVSGKYGRYPFYLRRLDQYSFGLEKRDFLEFIYFCLAIGFEDKWKEV